MLIKSLRRKIMRSSGISSKSGPIDLAIIGGRGYHSSYGGVENAIREISNQMAASTPVKAIVYGSDAGEAEDMPTGKTALAYRYAPKFTYQYFGQHAAVLACVLHALFVTRPKTVLIFASGPCVFVPLFRLFGTPVITSLRAIDSARDKWGMVSRTILQLGEFFAWRYSDVFTTNSEEMIRVFSVKRPDVVFVPNGSRPAGDADSHILRQLHLSNSGYFLFAARLDPVKRLHLLLEAHAQLKPEDRLPLIVAGGHSKSQKYQQQLQDLASPDVTFVGHISRQKLDPLMVNCRAFLLPSVLEGMSNSLLSAMATGCAVLASDIPPNSDVLKNPDAIFRSDDVVALRRGLEKLSRDPDFAQQLGVKLQTHAHNNYSWERTADIFYAQLEPYLTRVIADA